MSRFRKTKKPPVDERPHGDHYVGGEVRGEELFLRLYEWEQYQSVFGYDYGYVQKAERKIDINDKDFELEVADAKMDLEDIYTKRLRAKQVLDEVRKS